MEKIELVMVGNHEMCMNRFHDYLPTFGWKIRFSPQINSVFLFHHQGWRLRFVDEHPTNHYIFLFVEDNDGFDGMFSDLPYAYWEENEKMLATYHMALAANKHHMFFDQLKCEVIMIAGEMVMAEMLES